MHDPVQRHQVCHFQATSMGIEWISMVMFGVRFCRIDEPSHLFARGNPDLRRGFSFAGVAQW
jgi:hypothetical protein